MQIKENTDCKRVLAFLTKTRGLDYNMVTDLVKQGKIAQEEKTGNVLFKYFDDNGDLAGVEKVGTLTGKKFKGIEAGSAGDRGFEIVKGNGNKAYFFESSIDMLSFMQLHKEIYDCRLVSLMGLKPEIVMETILRNNITPDNVYICTDNDDAGNKFYNDLAEENTPMESFHRLKTPDNYKDWNDMLRGIEKEVDKMADKPTRSDMVWYSMTDRSNMLKLNVSQAQLEQLSAEFDKYHLSFAAVSKDNEAVFYFDKRSENAAKLVELLTDGAAASPVGKGKKPAKQYNNDYRPTNESASISIRSDLAFRVAKTAKDQGIRFDLAADKEKEKLKLTFDESELEKVANIVGEVKKARIKLPDRIEELEAAAEKAQQAELERITAEISSRKKNIAADIGNMSSADIMNFALELKELEKRQAELKEKIQSKAIRSEDVAKLQEIEPKKISIRNLLAQDVASTSKFEGLLQRELGEKSPYSQRKQDEKLSAENSDSTEQMITIVDIENKNKDFFSTRQSIKSMEISRDNITNSSLGVPIQISRKGLEDSVKYAKGYNENATYSMLYSINKILSKAVFLDTAISDKNKKNKAVDTMFMHDMYAIVRMSNEYYITKIAVEEHLARKDTVQHRLYNLQSRKIEPSKIIRFNDNDHLAYAVLDGSEISIAQLRAFVKTYYEDFYENPQAVGRQERLEEIEVNRTVDKAINSAEKAAEKEMSGLFRIEQNGEVRYYKTDSMANDLLKTARSSQHAFIDLSEMGSRISEAEYAEIEQSDRVKYSAEFDLDRQTADLTAINKGKGGIAEGDRKDSDIVTYHHRLKAPEKAVTHEQVQTVTEEKSIIHDTADKTENDISGLIDIEKLTVNGDTVYWEYFNEDGNDGRGQLVELTFTADDISEALIAVEAAGEVSEGYRAYLFVNYIEEHSSQTMTDYGSEDFEAAKEHFISGEYDFTVSGADSSRKITEFLTNAFPQRVEERRESPVIEDFRAKTDEYFHDIDGHSAEEIEALVREHAEAVFADSGIEATIKGVVLDGSRSRGIEHDGSDIDVVIEVDSELKEDALFNILHENTPNIGGFTVDVNPIRADQSGTLEDYLPKAEEYLRNKAHEAVIEQEQKTAPDIAGTDNSLRGIDAETAVLMWKNGFDVLVEGEKLPEYVIGGENWEHIERINNSVSVQAYSADIEKEQTIDSISSRVYDICLKYDNDESLISSYADEAEPRFDWSNTQNVYENVERALVGNNTRFIEDFLNSEIPISDELDELLDDIEAFVKQYREPELSDNEKYFLECDIVPILAKSALAWDEIESLGYRFFEEKYTERHDPSDRAIYGNGLHEPDLYALIERQRNGGDISEELVTGLLGGGNFYGRMSDSTERSTFEYTISQHDEGYTLSYGNVSRDVTFKELESAYHDLFYGEWDKNTRFAVYEFLKDDIPDISEDAVDRLIDAFDSAKMHGWESGDNQAKINRIKKAINEVLGNEDQTEKTFDNIAKHRYGIKITENVPVKEEPSLHFGSFGNGITAYDTARIDPETNDYLEVAHISEVGTVKMLTDDVSAEDMERIKAQAQPLRDKFMSEWSKLSVDEKYNKIIEQSDNNYDIVTSMNIAGDREKLTKEQAVEKYTSYVMLRDGERPEEEPDPSEATFKIYQLPAGEKYHGIRFEGKEQLEKDGVQLNHDDYDLVYEGEIDEFKENATLEAIFTQFNTDFPEDFRGRSLSVSDVVVVSTDGKDTAYFVDSFGFKEMPEFFHEKELSRDKEPELSEESPADDRAQDNGGDNLSAEKLTVDALIQRYLHSDFNRRPDSYEIAGRFLADFIDTDIDPIEYFRKHEADKYSERQQAEIILLMENALRLREESLENSVKKVEKEPEPVPEEPPESPYKELTQELEKSFDEVAEKTHAAQQERIEALMPTVAAEVIGRAANSMEMQNAVRNSDRDNQLIEAEKQFDSALTALMVDNTINDNDDIDVEIDKADTLRTANALIGRGSEYAEDIINKSAEITAQISESKTLTGHLIGSFYEFYDKDSEIISHTLNINRFPKGEHMMSGFPAYMKRSYSDKLAAEGYTVVFEEPMDRAMRLINEFCEEEYESSANFSNLDHVDIAYTTDEETDKEIQVYADLESFRIVTEYDGNIVAEELFDSVDDMCKTLEVLDFNELTSLSDELKESRSKDMDISSEKESKATINDLDVDDNAGAEQLTLFGEPEPLKAKHTKKNQRNTESKNIIDPSVKSISDDMIHYVLRCGSPERDSLSRIVAHFQKGKTDEENAAFLRKEFGNDGRGYVYNMPDDTSKAIRLSSWFDDNGIKITLGDNVDKNLVPSTKIPWNIAAQRIGKLLESGEYCSQDIIDGAADKEIKDIADKLWYLHQDTDKSIYQYFIPDEMFKGGFPDSTERIRNALLDKNTLQKYVNGLEQFVTDYEQNRDILRFHFHKPKELLSRLKDLQIERKAFKTVDDYSFKGQYFISEREIDTLLGYGGSYSGSKFRIEEYFKTEHTLPEKINFLKNAYGIGGGSKRGGDEWHDAKGISYSRGGTYGNHDCGVTIKWNEAANRIERLISEGKYITQNDIDHLIADCKWEINNFDPENSDDYDRKQYEKAVSTLAKYEKNGPEKSENENEQSEIRLMEDSTEVSDVPDDSENVQDIDVAEHNANEIGPDTFTITDEKLGSGNARAKCRANIEAIKTLKTIEAENRAATSEEKDILSRYVGWGGVQEAFDPDITSWADEYKELKEILTNEEYRSARATVNDAFFTSPTIIDGIYRALEQFGFKGGNVLEPSMGVGNFFGCMPEEMRANSELYGVEIDSISGRIAQALYPEADISIKGFEKNGFQNGSFDVAVGNVPFGDLSFTDKQHGTHQLHDYFFAEALDKVKEGGVIAFVTSSGTLDKKSENIRQMLADKADLIGAIRLPGGRNGAFKDNANTEVTSDIIFLKKHGDKTIAEMSDIPDWVHIGETSDGLPINKYFENHPDMVLGRVVKDSNPFSSGTKVIAKEDADLGELLREAVGKLTGTMSQEPARDVYPQRSTKTADITLPGDLPDSSFFEEKGKVYMTKKTQSGEVIFDTPNIPKNAEDKVKAYIRLRDTMRELINAMTYDRSDETIGSLQEKLTQQYDSFTEKYGILHDRNSARVLKQDGSFNLVSQLEARVDKNIVTERSAMFTARTIKPPKAIDHVDTPIEALALSVAEKGRVDFEYMSKLTDRSEESVRQELLMQGEIFRVPDSVEYQTSNEYLSGDLSAKLKAAEAAALDDTSFNNNIKALQAAMPEPLKAGDIDVRIGATWVKPEIYEQFIYETLQTPRDKRSGYKGFGFSKPKTIKLEYEPHTNTWNIENKALDRSMLATKTYGTDKMNAYDVFEHLLNLKDPKVYKTIEVSDGMGDVTEKRVVDEQATKILQSKAEKLTQEFEKWIFADPNRREELVSTYNELFNSVKPREYDGSHLSFPMMNTAIKLHDHQKNAIAHAMFGGNTLFAHCVGAGKTFEMIATAMESKRLGLCTKSLFAVPNHLTEQIGADFMKLYPSANILVATKNDFTKENRKQLFAKIATGNYDAVIIGHSQLSMIQLSPERQKEDLQREIDEISSAIEIMKKNGGSKFSVKKLEKLRQQLEKRMEELSRMKRDDMLCFEQLGIDRLFVDEAHEFKNLFTVTKLDNVSGIGNSPSKKAFDLYMKCRYLDEKTGSKGVILATGTPLTNSLTELHVMMRYLEHDMLRSKGLESFDSFIGAFGVKETDWELAPAGKGFKMRTRIPKFTGVPEIQALFKQVADVRTADTLKLDVPDCNIQVVESEPTQLQQDLVDELAERAEAVQNGSVEPSVDNLLKITSDGRKVGLDPRLVDPTLEDDPGTKLNKCVENVAKIYTETAEQKSTQIIFCDLGVPRKSSQDLDNDKDNDEVSTAEKDSLEESGDFCVYDDIRNKLIAKGISPQEIAYIHDAKSEKEKDELFAKVRSGEVRVLIGSTAKMGTGTNVQKKLIAVHDLDIPWRPADLEQRAGRIIRQGNENKNVNIFRYVTKGTFDAYSYQILEKKQRFISQIMTSKSPARRIDDVDQQALTFSEIKTLCTGDERIREKLSLENEVRTLQTLVSDHKNTVYEMEDRIKAFPEKEKKVQSVISELKADLDYVKKLPRNEAGNKPELNISIGGRRLESRRDIAEAINKAYLSITTADIPVKIGKYHDLDMYLTSNVQSNFLTISRATITIKGHTEYRIDIDDPSSIGTAQRIENTMSEAAIENRIDMRNSNLDRLRADLAEAKRIVSQPFPQQDELMEKQSRLKTLTEALTKDAIEAKKNAPKKQPTCYFSRAEHRKNLMKNIANAVPAKDKQKDKPKDKTAI